MRDCIAWPQNGGPAFYQTDLARDLVQYRRQAVKGPRRLGKTADAALILLWFALTRDGVYDWKALITAGVGRQVFNYFWPEVRRWARRLRWEVIGRDPFDTHTELLVHGLHLSTGLAFGAVSDKPDLIEGVGAQQFLVIFDEAKSIHDAVFDTLEAAMVDTADSTSYALALSTPGKPAGRFYDIFSRKPGLDHWHASSVTIEDAVKAGRRTQLEVDRLRLMWGETSTTFRCFVLGEFADDEEGALIQLAHVEAAVQRWRAFELYSADGFPQGRLDLERLLSELGISFSALGVDVGLSHDLTVFAPRFGRFVDTLHYHGREDPTIATMVTAGRVASLLNLYNRNGRAWIDSNGIGAGVYHRLREQGYKGVMPFNAGTQVPATMMDRSGAYGFVSKRAAAWWGLREYFDPTYGEDIAIPDDPRLIGDLTSIKYNPTSGGKIKVELKEETVARLGRSPDAGDAVMQAYWSEPTGVGFY